jgi:hypothetical protein
MQKPSRLLTCGARLITSEFMKTLRIGLVLIAAIAAMGLASARADQPHMKAALEHLRAAREELKVAEHDKGGWRVRALRNVDQAIADTERGIGFDRHH